MSSFASTERVFRHRASSPANFITQSAQPATGSIVIVEEGGTTGDRGITVQLTGVVATLTNNSGQAGATFDICTFARGNVVFRSAYGRIAVAASSGGVPATAANIAMSLGTAANATNNGTLATTEQNIIPTTNAAALVAGASVSTTPWIGALTTPAGFDSTVASPVTLRFNVGVPTGLTGDGTLTLTGVFSVKFDHIDVSETNPLGFV